eukprot:jgi/Mesvir1/5925/Mv00693-RA.1
MAATDDGSEEKDGKKQMEYTSISKLVSCLHSATASNASKLNAAWQVCFAARDGLHGGNAVTFGPQKPTALLEWLVSSLIRSSKDVDKSLAYGSRAPQLDGQESRKRPGGKGETRTTAAADDHASHGSPDVPACVDPRYWAMLGHVLSRDGPVVSSPSPWLTQAAIAAVQQGALRREEEPIVTAPVAGLGRIPALPAALGAVLHLLFHKLEAIFRPSLEHWVALVEACLEKLEAVAASQGQSQGAHPGGIDSRRGSWPDITLLVLRAFARFCRSHPNPRKLFSLVVARLLLPLSRVMQRASSAASPGALRSTAGPAARHPLGEAPAASSPLASHLLASDLAAAAEHVLLSGLFQVSLLDGFWVITSAADSADDAALGLSPPPNDKDSDKRKSKDATARKEGGGKGEKQQGRAGGSGIGVGVGVGPDASTMSGPRGMQSFHKELFERLSAALGSGDAGTLAAAAGALPWLLRAYATALAGVRTGGSGGHASGGSGQGGAVRAGKKERQGTGGKEAATSHDGGGKDGDADMVAEERSGDRVGEGEDGGINADEPVAGDEGAADDRNNEGIVNDKSNDEGEEVAEEQGGEGQPGVGGAGQGASGRKGKEGGGVAVGSVGRAALVFAFARKLLRIVQQQAMAARASGLPISHWCPLLASVRDLLATIRQLASYSSVEDASREQLKTLEGCAAFALALADGFARDVRRMRAVTGPAAVAAAPCEGAERGVADERGDRGYDHGDEGAGTALRRAASKKRKGAEADDGATAPEELGSPSKNHGGMKRDHSNKKRRAGTDGDIAGPAAPPCGQNGPLSSRSLSDDEDHTGALASALPAVAEILSECLQLDPLVVDGHLESLWAVALLANAMREVASTQRPAALMMSSPASLTSSSEQLMCRLVEVYTDMRQLTRALESLLECLHQGTCRPSPATASPTHTHAPADSSIPVPGHGDAVTNASDASPAPTAAAALFGGALRSPVMASTTAAVLSRPAFLGALTEAVRHLPTMQVASLVSLIRQDLVAWARSSRRQADDSLDDDHGLSPPAIPGKPDKTHRNPATSAAIKPEKSASKSSAQGLLSPSSVRTSATTDADATGAAATSHVRASAGAAGSSTRGYLDVVMAAVVEVHVASLASVHVDASNAAPLRASLRELTREVLAPALGPWLRAAATAGGKAPETRSALGNGGGHGVAAGSTHDNGGEWEHADVGEELRCLPSLLPVVLRLLIVARGARAACDAILTLPAEELAAQREGARGPFADLAEAYTSLDTLESSMSLDTLVHGLAGLLGGPSPSDQGPCPKEDASDKDGRDGGGARTMETPASAKKLKKRKKKKHGELEEVSADLGNDDDDGEKGRHGSGGLRPDSALRGQVSNCHNGRLGGWEAGTKLTSDSAAATVAVGRLPPALRFSLYCLALQRLQDLQEAMEPFSAFESSGAVEPLGGVDGPGGSPLQDGTGNGSGQGEARARGDDDDDAMLDEDDEEGAAATIAREGEGDVGHGLYKGTSQENDGGSGGGGKKDATATQASFGVRRGGQKNKSGGQARRTRASMASEARGIVALVLGELDDLLASPGGEPLALGDGPLSGPDGGHGWMDVRGGPEVGWDGAGASVGGATWHVAYGWLLTRHARLWCHHAGPGSLRSFASLVLAHACGGVPAGIHMGEGAEGELASGEGREEGGARSGQVAEDGASGPAQQALGGQCQSEAAAAAVTSRGSEAGRDGVVGDGMEGSGGDGGCRGGGDNGVDLITLRGCMRELMGDAGFYELHPFRHVLASAALQHLQKTLAAALGTGNATAPAACNSSRKGKPRVDLPADTLGTATKSATAGATPTSRMIAHDSNIANGSLFADDRSSSLSSGSAFPLNMWHVARVADTLAVLRHDSKLPGGAAPSHGSSSLAHTPAQGDGKFEGVAAASIISHIHVGMLVHLVQMLAVLQRLPRHYLARPDRLALARAVARAEWSLADALCSLVQRRWRRQHNHGNPPLSSSRAGGTLPSSASPSREDGGASIILNGGINGGMGGESDELAEARLLQGLCGCRSLLASLAYDTGVARLLTRSTFDGDRLSGMPSTSLDAGSKATGSKAPNSKAPQSSACKAVDKLASPVPGSMGAGVLSAGSVGETGGGMASAHWMMATAELTAVLASVTPTRSAVLASSSMIPQTSSLLASVTPLSPESSPSARSLASRRRHLAVGFAEHTGAALRRMAATLLEAEAAPSLAALTGGASAASAHSHPAQARYDRGDAEGAIYRQEDEAGVTDDGGNEWDGIISHQGTFQQLARAVLHHADGMSGEVRHALAHLTDARSDADGSGTSTVADDSIRKKPRTMAASTTPATSLQFVPRNVSLQGARGATSVGKGPDASKRALVDGKGLGGPLAPGGSASAPGGAHALTAAQPLLLRMNVVAACGLLAYQHALALSSLLQSLHALLDGADATWRKQQAAGGGGGGKKSGEQREGDWHADGEVEQRAHAPASFLVPEEWLPITQRLEVAVTDALASVTGCRPDGTPALSHPAGASAPSPSKGHSRAAAADTPIPSQGKKRGVEGAWTSTANAAAASSCGNLGSMPSMAPSVTASAQGPILLLASAVRAARDDLIGVGVARDGRVGTHMGADAAGTRASDVLLAAAGCLLGAAGLLLRCRLLLGSRHMQVLRMDLDADTGPWDASTITNDSTPGLASARKTIPPSWEAHSPSAAASPSTQAMGALTAAAARLLVHLYPSQGHPGGLPLPPHNASMLTNQNNSILPNRDVVLANRSGQSGGPLHSSLPLLSGALRYLAAMGECLGSAPPGSRPADLYPRLLALHLHLLSQHIGAIPLGPSPGHARGARHRASAGSGAALLSTATVLPPPPALGFLRAATLDSFLSMLARAGRQPRTLLLRSLEAILSDAARHGMRSGRGLVLESDLLAVPGDSSGGEGGREGGGGGGGDDGSKVDRGVPACRVFAALECLLLFVEATPGAATSGLLQQHSPRMLPATLALLSRAALDRDDGDDDLITSDITTAEIAPSNVGRGRSPTRLTFHVLYRALELVSAMAGLPSHCPMDASHVAAAVNVSAAIFGTRLRRGALDGDDGQRGGSSGIKSRGGGGRAGGKGFPGSGHTALLATGHRDLPGGAVIIDGMMTGPAGGVAGALGQGGMMVPMLVFRACCNLLCTLLRDRPQETRRCMAAVVTGVGCLLATLARWSHLPVGVRGVGGAEACGESLRRVYEEVAARKASLGKYCAFLLADYISALAGGARGGGGLSRDCAASLKGGVYAVMGACSHFDMQTLHANLLSDPVQQSALAGMWRDYEQNHKYTGKV